jgi:hypothetical protein
LQCEGKFTPAFGCFIHPDSAAVRFNRQLAEIQTDPRTAPPPLPISNLHERSKCERYSRNTKAGILHDAAHVKALTVQPTLGADCYFVLRGVNLTLSMIDDHLLDFVSSIKTSVIWTLRSCLK